ncbi:MAG: hypothetical protein AB8G86_14645 [Saprospiraceae bacterium]
MKANFLIAFLTCCWTSILAQPAVIHLKNPSFEDYPMAESVPEGWRNCGFAGESAPDTHPSGAFSVDIYPSEGKTYLGMATRDNSTYESVGQKLAIPLVGGQCYTFKLSLCQSTFYLSISRLTGKRINYDQPVKLVVLAGNDFCDQSEILAETKLINHEEWKAYFIQFKPSADYSHIQLAAYYDEALENAHNGNLLVDNASPIVPIPCDSVHHWQSKKLNAILKKAGRKKVKITKEDIDASRKSRTTDIDIDKKLDLSFMPPIYYNSTLNEAEKEVALKKVLFFVENSAATKAAIIIQEPTRKEQKLQKELLIKKLKDIGVPKGRYYINMHKK